MSNWISINDELPCSGELVNVRGGDVEGVSSGWFSPLHSADTTTFDVLDEDEMVLLSATHWQHLPEPPK